MATILTPSMVLVENAREAYRNGESNAESPDHPNPAWRKVTVRATSETPLTGYVNLILENPHGVRTSIIARDREGLII